MIKKEIPILDVGAGLMTTLVHMAQEFEGFHWGVNVCQERARLFANSYKILLRKYIWNNKKIAYIRNDVKDVDETMPPDAWYKMMESFCQS
jgi:hypothetical protein